MSDAAGGAGWAITLGPVTIAGQWDAVAVEELAIGVKELYPIGLLLAEIGDLLVGCAFQPTTDNLSNVYAMLCGKTSEKGAKAWLAAILTA